MVNPNRHIKIALVGDSLSKGGAEKVHALLSNYFFQNGYEVYNCILIDGATYEYSGSLLNLGKIKANSSSVVRKFYRFRALQKWISTNNFDCLIDFRMRPSFVLESVLSRIIYPINAIYTVHSGFLRFYFPKSNILAQFIYKNRKVITVSQGIKNKVQETYHLKTVKTIFNPLDLDSIAVLKEEKISVGKYILIVGSMDSPIKQIDQLILAYSKSELPENKVQLIILGEGKLKTSYQEFVESLDLADLILFKGMVTNPFPFYKNALFYVLSSKNEGLPNAILESLACKTPVVAFDCFSGPREIITNHYNGILVEDQNFEKLTEAMNLMISDTQLYFNCKKNALESVQRFSIEAIGRHWLEVIKV